jgi:excisionase family DNA binding protein
MSIHSTDLDNDERRLGVSPKIACEMIGCGITTLYALLADKRLESYRIGRARRITTESIRVLVTHEIERSKAA